MASIGASLRVALERARRITIGLALTGHWPGWLGLAAVVAVAAIVPALADPPADPAARLQLVVKKLHVLDDRDTLGSGEMSFFAGLCLDGPPDDERLACGGPELVTDLGFGAISGDEADLERPANKVWYADAGLGDYGLSLEIQRTNRGTTTTS